MQAKDYIEKFSMTKIEEGGYFSRKYQSDQRNEEGKRIFSAGYYLLEKGQISKWHKLLSDEFWLWHDGGRIELTYRLDKEERKVVLGRGGESFSFLVPKEAWQTARLLDGDFAIITNVVLPEFLDEEIFFEEEDV